MNAVRHQPTPALRMNRSPAPKQRVSAVSLPARYELPGTPEDAPEGVQEAYRQTASVLGNDLHLFQEGMRLQLRIAGGQSSSMGRTHAYAALIGLWSRAFQALSDACLLVTRASYASCPPLVRTACECIAAQHQLHATDMGDFLDWLAADMTPNEEHEAFDMGLGRYFAGEPLATDERLRRVYRPASELGRPSFGATLLQVGPESDEQRLALTFGAGAFHAGWSEVVLGWLLALCERQLAVSVRAEDIYAIAEEARVAYGDFARRVDEAVARPGRCSIDEVDEDGVKRLLARDFRREPGGAPRRILL